MRYSILAAIIILVSTFLYIFIRKKESLRETCNSCKTETGITSKRHDPVVSDSLVFELSPDHGYIRTDISPKLVNGFLYFLTDKKYIIRYTITGEQAFKPELITKLPKVQPFVSDFMIVNDTVIIYVSALNSELVEYNHKTHKTKVRELSKYAFANSLPFLGLVLIRHNDNYIFPFTRRKDVQDHAAFLGVYDKNYHYINSLGSLRSYEDEHYAAYPEAPILSGMVENSIWATTTSSQGVVKYEMDEQTSELSKKEVYCFENPLYGKPKEPIPKDKLGDFKFLNEVYITSSYVVNLKVSGKNIYRITKGKQQFLNKKRLLNNIENAEWTLEKFDTETHELTFGKVGPEKFKFMNNFILDGKLYFLSFNNQKLIYYALS